MIYNACVILIILVLIVVISFLYYNKNEKKVTKPNLPEKFEDKKDKPVMVLVYADWCPHCKHFKPVWGRMRNHPRYGNRCRWLDIEAEKDKKYENLVKRLPIKGYPTVFYFPKGLNGDYELYKGGRNEEDIFKFLDGKK